MNRFPLIFLLSAMALPAVASSVPVYVGTPPSGGAVPSGASLSPDGSQLLVANQKRGNFVAFKVDLQSGDLKQTGKPVRVAQAVCVLFAGAK